MAAGRGYSTTIPTKSAHQLAGSSRAHEDVRDGYRDDTNRSAARRLQEIGCHHRGVFGERYQYSRAGRTDAANKEDSNCHALQEGKILSAS